MPLITAQDVMSLRKLTGLGMMEAKKALTDAAGDVDSAVKLLREQGLAKMDSRSDRASTEGRIALATSGKEAAMVELNTETDFTANNDQFVAMAETVAQQALEAPGHGTIDKNAAMQQAIDEVRLTTKENVQYARGVKYGGPGKSVGSYLHFTGKVGVLVEFAGQAPESLAKDVAMHISAIQPVPLGVEESDVPKETIDEERRIAKKQAMDTGKPEDIAEKMVEGKIRKYLDTVVLLRQPFIKDDKQTIQNLLPEGVSIIRFARFAVGG